MASFIEQQEQIRQDYSEENGYKRKRYTLKSILFNTTVQGWIFIVLFALFIPLFTYYIVVERGSYKKQDSYTCYVNTTFRVPCGKVNITANDCDLIGCCYNKSSKMCYHYLPSKYSYDLDGNFYRVSRKSSPLNTKSYDSVTLYINETSENEVSIILSQPLSIKTTKSLIRNSDSKNYIVKLAKEKLMVEVIRPDNSLILSTARGPLIASENYWEWTIYLTNHTLFGINQTIISLNENSTFSKVFYSNTKDQSSIPVLWAYQNGKFHGVKINHEGPLELTILPSNLVIIRSLTGRSMEIVLSLGPTPKELHDQQMTKFDVTSLPYWVFGIHVCRKQTDYRNVTYLLEQFQKIDSQADSYCIDENLFMGLLEDNKSNIDKLNEVIQTQSDNGKKFLMSIPPQVPNNTNLYQIAEELGVFYNYNNLTYKGSYLKEHVSYPDYHASKIQLYMEEVDKFITNKINATIDGFILTDNWPIDENFVMDNNTFPYFTNDLQDAMSNTIPWNATFNNSYHIYSHNIYGASQFDAFNSYYNSHNITKVLMSATKSLEQTEPNVLENVDISWENMINYLVETLFNSITGNHLVSVPVCGDTSNFNDITQLSLCLRWYIVAATMPLFRVTSLKPWRNPDDINAVYAQEIIKQNIERRRFLLPYYYSILVREEPLVRPMFYDFYENTTTFSIKNQYMIGEKILVAHPTTSESRSLKVYLPPRIKVWYEMWGGEMFTTNETEPYVNINIIDTDFLAFLAQGTIVPLVDQNTINLIIALNNTGNSSIAEGDILIDNDYISFSADDNTVKVNFDTDLNYKVGYIKLYYYENTTGYQHPFVKDQNLSDTIYYIDPTTTEAPTTASRTETTTESSTEQISTSESSSSTSESSTENHDLTTEEPSSSTKESSSITSETSTQQPSSTTAESSSEPINTSESSSTTSESSTENHDSTTEEPSSSTEETSSITYETSTQQPSSTTTEPGSSTSESSTENHNSTTEKPSSSTFESSTEQPTNTSEFSSTTEEDLYQAEMNLFQV